MRKMVGNNFRVFWWNRPPWLVVRVWHIHFYNLIGGERYYRWFVQ
jgi:hypothetical protein